MALWGWNESAQWGVLHNNLWKKIFDSRTAVGGGVALRFNLVRPDFKNYYSRERARERWRTGPAAAETAGSRRQLMNSRRSGWNHHSQNEDLNLRPYVVGRRALPRVNCCASPGGSDVMDTKSQRRGTWRSSGNVWWSNHWLRLSDLLISW